MNALDIFRGCAALDEEIDSTRENIERRRALASGCTARPLSPDGGSSGSGDASMRMLDYMSEVEKLEAKIEEKKALRESYRSCCFYLAELLVPTLAKVVLRHYLEHKSIRQIANEIQYSYATVKRYKRQADDNLSLIEILYWDRVHVPMILLREGFQGNVNADSYPGT